MLWKCYRTFRKVDRKLLHSGIKMNFPEKQFSQRTNNITSVQNKALDQDLCLLVDENDNFIGSATKRVCHKINADGKLPLHRAFSVLLFNSQGDLLVQKRASQKVTYPSTYTNTCCSHPLMVNNAPEDIISAAIRRLDTELGIPPSLLNREDFTLVARILYMDPGDGVWGEHELDYVLLLQNDVPVQPNPDEIELVEYVPKKQFDSFMERLQDPVTPWFKLMHRYMLHYWWNNLHRLKEIAEPDLVQSFINKP